MHKLRLSSASLLTLALLAAGPVANAQTATSANANAGVDVSAPTLPAPGMLPDSAFYGLDIALEHIGDIFVSGDAQIHRDARIAKERLAEARSMKEKGDNEHATEALARAEERLNRAADEISNREDDAAGKADLLLEVQEAVARHQEVLIEVKTDAPESAQPGLDNAIEASGKVIDKLNEVRAEIEDDQEVEVEVRDQLEATPVLEKLEVEVHSEDQDEAEDESDR